MTRFLTPPPAQPVHEAAAPSFSVVIPVRDGAEFVADAVRSALVQSYEPLEVIVCDDGSEDDPAAALAPYADRVRLLTQPPRGVSAARNLGVRHARGEFVAFLDADDVFEPGRLQALAELARIRPDLDILCTDLILEAEGEAERRFSATTPFATRDQDIAILDRCFVAAPAVRRRRLDEVGGFDESLRLGEDWDCVIRMMFAGARAGLVDEPLLRYRRRATSLTGDRPAALRARVTVLERLAADTSLSPHRRRALSAALVRNRRRVGIAEAHALEGTLRRHIRLASLRAPSPIGRFVRGCRALRGRAIGLEHFSACKPILRIRTHSGKRD